jgi:hypothetical protein
MASQKTLRGRAVERTTLDRLLNAVLRAEGHAAQPLADRNEQSVLRRVRSLPPDSQRPLLTAAEPVSDVTLLWRAAERLAVGPDAVAAAEAAGLIELGGRVRFRHPLVRSAIYRERRRREDRREQRADREGALT